MKISEADILIVPGLGNSGPGHWQRRWQDKMSNAAIVDQRNWDNPEPEEWVQTLQRAILMATRPVVLVGHSLGAVTIVHTAQALADSKVRGAFLVCAPDIDENSDVPDAALPFGNVPRDPLPFPSLLIGSETDPYCSIERAGDLGNAWGSEFHSAGDAGHINIESGHGPWPEGLMMFTRLMQRLRA